MLLTRWGIGGGIFLRITSIPPPSETAGPDRCIWRWTAMGQFSVSTAYKHLVAGCLESKEEHWKHLRMLRAPFRVKHFLERTKMN